MGLSNVKWNYGISSTKSVGVIVASAPYNLKKWTDTTVTL